MPRPARRGWVVVASTSGGNAREQHPRIPYASELLDVWVTRELDVCPWDGFGGFNPSVHRDSKGQWRCTVRCADYSMPDGSPVVPSSGRIQNRNVMVELDDDLEVSRVIEMRECFEPGLVTSNQVAGVEDLRLFETEQDGLCAISTAMQFNRDSKQEIVLLILDTPYQITDAIPLRGLWSRGHQKNWSPFDKSLGCRLLYSVEKGGIHDGHGMIELAHGLDIEHNPEDTPDFPAELQALASGRTAATPRVYRNGGMDVKLIQKHPRMAAPVTGKVDLGPFALRGGSQLVPLDQNPISSAPCDRYLGIAHGVRMFGTYKFYWHVIYTTDYRGVMLQRSAPMKLSTSGIEFAAGLAIDFDHDRAVISFGTEDRTAHLAETTISSLVAQLRPVSMAGDRP